MLEILALAVRELVRIDVVARHDTEDDKTDREAQGSSRSAEFHGTFLRGNEFVSQSYSKTQKSCLIATLACRLQAFAPMR